ncbi:NAD(P)-dependent oxidoreductase [Chryseosolibacter indicus]|uniref:NAD(P)-dependent oxidoreductase n=1 Tax=Chryseosolibacter indicus TaxID=2782351 RepID=A0ABS5VPR2_9BACT|nr:NAD(P)-dependent oxidoreductase [Chryseosolibacter indicus]MBT1702839.1 NAD(P)-dependent oxidoreductase [Chryseosolibacter indicus]
MIITFIGLGNMGLPMATNLIKAGFQLRAFNRSAGKREAIKALGATIFDKAEEAAKDADVVITMLSDDAAVDEINKSILPAMKKGSIHLSMSTISPASATRFEEQCKKHNVVYLASPVMGRPPAAEAKQLFILLSGATAEKGKVQPVLQAMGQRVFDFGEEVASANTVKLIMNYMIFVTTEMLSEVMLVAEKAGIQKQVLLDTMLSTIFGAPVMKNYGNLIIEEKDNLNGFATKLASKDLRLMQETALAQDLRLPLAEIIQSSLQEIINAGGGGKDISYLVTHLREKLKQ